MSKQREALQMALEMIEFNRHERRHVRWAIKEALCQTPAISQSIRDAAINWPQYLGDVECGVIDAFCYPYQTPYWQSDLRRYETSQARTFMLLVAEALE